MKWFFALNDHAFRAERYWEMVRVAVHSALSRTSLVPHLLYDGEENECTDWLRRRDVRIIRCQTFANERLEAIARDRHDANLLSIGAGTLLRIEIPRVALQEGIEDDFVLYTDVDVVFLNDVSRELSRCRPTYFAAAGEFDARSVFGMNAGVMLMNLRNLRRVDARFRSFVAAHLHQFVDQAWDQAAYREFFGRGPVTKRVFGPKWSRLPPSFNWKPYWGRNPAANIVHFHGPKPHDREMLATATPPPESAWMAPLATDGYVSYCDLWAELLLESGSEPSRQVIPGSLNDGRYAVG